MSHLRATFGNVSTFRNSTADLIARHVGRPFGRSLIASPQYHRLISYVFAKRARQRGDRPSLAGEIPRFARSAKNQRAINNSHDDALRERELFLSRECALARELRHSLATARGQTQTPDKVRTRAFASFRDNGTRTAGRLRTVGQGDMCVDKSRFGMQF